MRGWCMCLRGSDTLLDMMHTLGKVLGFVSVLFVCTSCNISSQQGEVLPPESLPALSIPNLDATYTNEKLGIQFEYPTVWGPIEEVIEQTCNLPTTEDPCEHVGLVFYGLPTKPVFLASFCV